jgi:hypothetical protein
VGRYRNLRGIPMVELAHNGSERPQMRKPRELTPRPRKFDTPGSKNKPVERKPEVLPAAEEQQQKAIKKRRVASETKR